MKHMAAPCKECPFSKDIEPGALGGSPVETYIGQAIGPFILPCHMACDFSDPHWKQKAINTPQCAGAAHFRANIGVAEMLPSQIHKLPESEKSFANLAEFVAHHLRTGIDQARVFLRFNPPAALLRKQMGRTSNIHYNKE
jgi:hypothetical protein